MGMKENVKAEWIKRLTDGRPQISEYLHSAKGQCCLGVLSEMAYEAGAVTREEEDGLFIYADNGSCAPLPVLEWAGLPTKGLTADIVHILPITVDDEGKRVNTLAEANDAGLTFAEIAKIIENEL
jgi:hypothetical protein